MQNADELWQLYDAQGQPLAGEGATKKDVFYNGLLHAASHIWIWHRTDHGPEVLLQKRSATKATWPNFYDISAGGHIDLGEMPLATALRETREEIGIEVAPANLQLINVHRTDLRTGDIIENEFQWIYLLELPDKISFNLETKEVAAIEWQPLEDFITAALQADSTYVPHGDLYYQTVAEAIRKAVA